MESHLQIAAPPQPVQQALVMLQNLQKEQDFLATALSFYLGGPVCMPDCGRCCHQSFTIPRFSGLYIAVAINTFPEDDRKYIVGQLEKWLLYELPDVRSRFSSDGQDEEQLRLKEYRIIHRLSCPLLAPDMKCLIYPWRDPVCRAYAVTRPVAKCPRPFFKGESEGNRRFISAKISLEKQREALVNHFKEHAPDWLNEYWLPTIIYAYLEPERWKTLSKRVQQAKYAPYQTERLWLLTAEDSRDNTFAGAGKAFEMEPEFTPINV